MLLKTEVIPHSCTRFKTGWNQREAAGHICLLRNSSDPLYTGILVRACYWPFSVPNSASVFSFLRAGVGLDPTNKDYNYFSSPSWTVQLSTLRLGITLGTVEWNSCSQVWTKLQVPSLSFKQQFDELLSGRAELSYSGTQLQFPSKCCPTSCQFNCL